MMSRRSSFAVLATGIAVAFLASAGCASKSTPAPTPVSEPSAPPNVETPPAEAPTETSASGGASGGGAEGPDGSDASESSATGDASGATGADAGSGAAGAAPPPTGVGRTTGERQAEIDAELHRSLSEFDRMLIEQQRQIEQELAEATNRGGEESLAGTGDAETGGASRDAGTSSTRSGGVPSRGGSGSAPPGTPDGSDDDIVARQLREAAENEEDPELRAKLWEEYRAYNGREIDGSAAKAKDGKTEEKSEAKSEPKTEPEDKKDENDTEDPS